ncbi:MAG: hypothetical protein HYZ27_11685, partial [Deltaproteobacteria bacterium]|nr:hypothetical protein [Deltaproteobacteria bacterium]
MGADRQSSVPDILLELYLAGDLPEAERHRIETARDESEMVRRRLAELKAEREAFLAAHPPAAFAHQVATRLAHEEPPARPHRLWTFLPPVAALAAGLTAVVIFTRFGDERTAPLRPATRSAPVDTLAERPSEAPSPPKSEKSSESARGGDALFEADRRARGAP